MGQRELSLTMVLVGSAFILCPHVTLFGGIELSGDSNITIVEEGPFDSAKGALSDLLEKYLLLALEKRNLSGTGTKVTFTIRTEASYWHELPRDTIKHTSDIDAFEIAVSGSPQSAVTITGRTPLATGYGVMFFLEKRMGILWALPGELGLCLPKRQSFHLDDEKERVSPWIVARSMSGLDLRDRQGRQRTARTIAGVLREQRAFFLAGDYFKSMRLHPGTVHHNMIKIFPVEQCKAYYPQVFPMAEDGTRLLPGLKDRNRSKGKNSYQAWHPCYSSRKAVEIAIAKGKETFEQGSLFYSLGINDGNRVQCQCPHCRKAGWPHSYYRFVNEVADALKSYYPPHMVGVLAYGEVGIPPKDLELAENVLVNVAGVRKSVWESLAPALDTYEYIYGAGYVIGNLPLDIIQENMRYYKAHNLRMYYAEFYPVWAFDAPKAYIISRLLWNPEQDVYKMLGTFCECAFGEAAEPMYRFYEHIASIRKSDVQRGRFTPVWGKVWPFRDPLQFFRCPEDLHERLFACLSEAKAKDLTARQKERIAMVAAFTEFSRVYYQMYRLKEDVFAGGADPRRTLSLAAEFKSKRETVFAAFREHPEWFKGSSATLEGSSDRAWPTGRIDQQLEAAGASAGLKLLESEDAPGQELSRYAGTPVRTPIAFLPYRKSEHPWYKPTQHTRMELLSQRGSKGLAFKTAANLLIQPHEDHRYHGKPKAQWLHGRSHELAVREDLLYAVECNLQGRRGMLELRLHGTTGTQDRDKLVFAHCMHAFGRNEESLTRRVIIDPVRSLEKPGRDKAGIASEATIFVQLYLRWRADDLSSELNGNVYLDQITIGSSRDED